MSFKGKSPPSTPSLPAQQAAPELMDVIDEISGVQTVTVTGPDGRKRRITQKLPLTEQEQRIMTQAENLISQSLDNIQSLYKYDPSTVTDYQPFIQAFSSINNERLEDLSKIGNFENILEKVQNFRDMNKTLTMNAFDKNQRMSEEMLSRRGLGRSTEATELRAAMAKERALLEQQVDVSSYNYGQDLKTRQMQDEASIYGLRESGRQGRLQQAEAAYNLERQKAADAENIRQNYIGENMNLLNIGNSIKSADNQKAQMALAGNQNAISMLNAQSADQNNRFSNEIGRIKSQYSMDLDNFRSTPATFGQKIGDIGLSMAGNYAGTKLGQGMATLGAESSKTKQSAGRQKTFGELLSLGGK